ncbi:MULTISPECIES: FAD-dependent oxidoreductase [unclassified Bosea (in: a-proteobacteria)]|uniref:FAD-dependent oxidoreductase n=1 Tax=unclassified Bosea (in: a-proteobacteria) TaxID=2653178 RepID=UPI000F7578D6|nr:MULTISPECIES: FAD-dependent oxidoreductase [unclassified Bosea (in: a-proteobacteria)]AZO77053.1 flavoprotein [Bosea sp. Tri-49]RXT21898.1 flavoprotein [Bosea sp. Tri-39]RXT32237.1 flavoprotein [Bosea sp. Tri-54]
MMELPVAVIGAGPVGLAAAANLVARGLAVKVYEAGIAAGANISDWGHVRLFSPWAYNVDPTARSLLEKAGWRAPDEAVYPTGADLVSEYLAPLAQSPALAPFIEYGVRVRTIGRRGIDKVVSRDRELHPFQLAIVDSDGRVRHELARAVIDASGTWASPNPLGAGGVAAEGEEKFAGRIAYSIPDVLGGDRARYAGRTTIVVGAGHSAANVLLDLAELATQEPATKAIWLTRGSNLSRVYGGGANDQLAARGDLGQKLRQLVETGRVELVTRFAVTTMREVSGQLALDGETPDGLRTVGAVDRVVVCTGQRPDLAMTRELRIELDPWLESAKALGPMIDPNLHSCGSVPPHGHRELSHPEPGFYTVGIKSYGRAPTFLMLTGYEQARSVVAAIAGDMAAADDVQLVLPETGVCTTAPESAGGCCGGPAPTELDACCVDDFSAKAQGKAGCGCSSSAKASEAVQAQ